MGVGAGCEEEGLARAVTVFEAEGRELEKGLDGAGGDEDVVQDVDGRGGVLARRLCHKTSGLRTDNLRGHQGAKWVRAVG